jgi:hypothetical protein
MRDYQLLKKDSGFSWLRKRLSGRLMGTPQLLFVFHDRREIF